jgi:glycosyltransferase involved in cell wall biosynthesis
VSFISSGVNPNQPRTTSTLISVIMPNFNHAPVISRALRALVQQVPAALEIIVIDDASTDDSVEVIKSIQDKHRQIRLIRHDSNRGTAAGIRTGIETASGEYLYFTAADDVVLPGLFASALAALEANPAAAFFCADVAIIDRGGAVIGLRPLMAPRASGGYLSPANVRTLFRSSDNWFVGPSVIYRRQPLSAIDYFDVALGSMCDPMTNRLLAFRNGFYYAPEILAACSVAPDTFSARSALSRTESSRLIEASCSWIARRFPEDVRGWYERLYERRLRFGMARLWLVWQQRRLDADAIADLLDFGAFDRAVVRATSRFPLDPSLFVLVWMTVRMRPFGIPTLVKALVRQATYHWISPWRTKPAVQRLLQELRNSAPNQ